MPTDVETLAEMGFSENRAAKALAKTGYKGVQAAMDWLLVHMDDADIDEPMEVSQGHSLTDPPADTDSTDAGDNNKAIENATPKSLKCDECGKLLRTENDVQMHATRSGHTSFSESTEEIKPLTAEEKAAQLAQVQQLIKQKRAEKEAKEKQEQIEREKMRRVQGKELIQIKQKHEEDEMKKLMEQKRREKEEERLAKQRVREQIEKDKRDRAAKFGTNVSGGGGGGASLSTSVPPAAGTASGMSEGQRSGPSSSAQTGGPKQYNDTKLQIRLPGGEALTQVFQAKEQLSAVRLYVTLNRTDGDQSPFTFKTTFPNRCFTEDDMQAPLSSLGLVPSAVLIVSRLTR